MHYQTAGYNISQTSVKSDFLAVSPKRKPFGLRLNPPVEELVAFFQTGFQGLQGQKRKEGYGQKRWKRYGKGR